MLKRLINHFREKKEKDEKCKNDKKLLDESLALFYGDFSSLLEKTREMDSELLMQLIEKGIIKALDDNYFSIEEEQRIVAFLNHYKIEVKSLPLSSGQRLMQGLLLRDLFECRIHPRFPAISIPFNLMKKEILLWAFAPVPVSEIRIQKHWEGKSRGTTFRVMKGVYWRVGSSSGQLIEREIIKNLGAGIVAVTNFHVYVKAGISFAKRIKLEKIVSVDADSQSVIVNCEGTNSRPLCFKTDEAWFLANLIQNATNWQ